MAVFLYNMLSSLGLLSLGLYHLISSTLFHLKSPHSYSAKPFHPFPPSSSSSSSHHRLRHLPVYLIILSLFIAFIHQLIISSETDPLVKGHTPVHRFISLQSAAVLFLFLILVLSLLLSESCFLLPFSSDLIFALASVLFFLHYSVSSAAASIQISDLEAKCDSVSAKISAFAALLCLLLAFQPKLFVADVGLGAAICLQGLWVFQTGLSLYVDAFIPEGCHRLLDVVDGVEGSTKCDLEESKLRAVAILDLIFLVHVMFVVLIVMITYAGVAKSVGNRRLGSYDGLPNTSSHSENSSLVQMKALTGTQA